MQKIREASGDRYSYASDYEIIGQLKHFADQARFVSEHRDTRLIIIDTLQKIREASGDRYSYASDYEIIGQLKHFADQTGIALLLVHHTRKQQADDKFDMISGTNFDKTPECQCKQIVS